MGCVDVNDTVHMVWLWCICVCDVTHGMGSIPILCDCDVWLICSQSPQPLWWFLCMQWVVWMSMMLFRWCDCDVFVWVPYPFCVIAMCDSKNNAVALWEQFYRTILKKSQSHSHRMALHEWAFRLVHMVRFISFATPFFDNFFLRFKAFCSPMM